MPSGGSGLWPERTVDSARPGRVMKFTRMLHGQSLRQWLKELGWRAADYGRPDYPEMHDRSFPMRITARAVVLGAALFAVLASGLASGAQQYPSRTITLVVPFPPGGGNDATARMI